MGDIDLLADWVHSDLEPDATILLDAPADVGLARAGDRSDPDRFESERLDFFERVRTCYLELAEKQPERFVVVDARQDLAKVRDAVVAAAKDLI